MVYSFNLALLRVQWEKDLEFETNLNFIDPVFKIIKEHPFNLNTAESEAGELLEFEATLLCTMSSRIAKVIQRNPV